MLAHEGTAPETIPGPVDALKLCPSATLFEAAGARDVRPRILAAFRAGRRCAETQRLLAPGGGVR